MNKYQIGGKLLFSVNAKTYYVITGETDSDFIVEPGDISQFKSTPLSILNKSALDYLVDGEILIYEAPKEKVKTLFSFDDL